MRTPTSLPRWEHSRRVIVPRRHPRPRLDPFQQQRTSARIAPAQGDRAASIRESECVYFLSCVLSERRQLEHRSTVPIAAIVHRGHAPALQRSLKLKSPKGDAAGEPVFERVVCHRVTVLLRLLPAP